MKQRSYKDDGQVSNSYHSGSYPECSDEPKRAVRCWFMNRFYLHYQEATAEQLTATGQDSGSVWKVWRAGKCSSPQLEQDKLLHITTEAAAVQRQSLQTWLEGNFANEVPPTLAIMFSHFFLFSCMRWVSSVAAKGVSSSEYYDAAHLGEICANFCVQQLPRNHITCSKYTVQVANKFFNETRLLISEVN